MGAPSLLARQGRGQAGVRRDRCGARPCVAAPGPAWCRRTRRARPLGRRRAAQGCAPSAGCRPPAAAALLTCPAADAPPPRRRPPQAEAAAASPAASPRLPRGRPPEPAPPCGLPAQRPEAHACRLQLLQLPPAQVVSSRAPPHRSVAVALLLPPGRHWGRLLPGPPAPLVPPRREDSQAGAPHGGGCPAALPWAEVMPLRASGPGPPPPRLPELQGWATPPPPGCGAARPVCLALAAEAPRRELRLRSGARSPVNVPTVRTRRMHFIMQQSLSNSVNPVDSEL